MTRRTLTTGRGPALRILATATAVALSMTLPSASPAAADQTYYVPVSDRWTITGHGYGHGHGLSQYGAQGAALKGLRYRQIVDFYYPGTSWAKAGGSMRVLISSDSTSDLQVRPATGLRVRDLDDGSSWRLPTERSISRWRLTPARDNKTMVQYLDSDGWHRWRIPGGRRTFGGNGQFTADTVLTLLVPSGGDVVGRKYRGALRLVRPFPGAEGRDTVNVVGMDAYVKGVLPYEMPTSWHQQALRAQSIAARTYGAYSRAQNPRRYYHICDTTSCQVYGGRGAEVASTNKAVAATAGRILTYRSRPAFTQFSASSGGWTSAGSAPYLPAKRDPYDKFPGNSVHDWRVSVNAASLEAAHPHIGRLVKVRVTEREGHGEWGGRVQQMVLHGTKGKAYMTGDDLRWHFGLRSSWFTIEPTPIMARWRVLGGRKSALGMPDSGEKALRGGASQRFDHGRIYWTADTGARELLARVLRAYHKFGGPGSRIGWPVTGMLQAKGGRKARFERGSVFASAETGGHVLHGPILRRYQDKGGPSSRIGFPTTNVRKVPVGSRASFEAAVMTFHRDTGEVVVRRR